MFPIRVNYWVGARVVLGWSVRLAIAMAGVSVGIVLMGRR